MKASAGEQTQRQFDRRRLVHSDKDGGNKAETGRGRERERETERERPSRETKSDQNFTFGVDAGII